MVLATGTPKCRNPTNNVNEDCGIYARTSVESYIGAVVSGGQCRDPSTHFVVGSGDNLTGWESSTNSKCTQADATKCKNPSTGVLDAIGTKGWTAADNAICDSIRNGKCRDPATKLAITLANNTTGKKSASD